jgi:hypothetical protein
MKENIMTLQYLISRKEGYGLSHLSSLIVATAFLLTFIAPALAADSFSLGEAQVVNAPQFSAQASRVVFDEPRFFSTGAGVTKVTEIVQVIVRGEGFQPKATGPVVWLNNIPTLRTDVSEDGTRVEAYFLEPLQALREAAAREGGWQVIYQPHAGAPEVYRISLDVDPSLAH